MKTTRIFLVITALVFCLPALASNTENSINQHFKRIQQDPIALYQFLYKMPKGGDLHNHFTGATYAENLIAYGNKDPFCVTPESYAVTPATQCQSKLQIANAQANTDFFNALVANWSMHNFVAGQESREDHFFNSFAKFGLLVSKHAAEILTEITNRAGGQHLSYLELMLTSYDLSLVGAEGEMMAALGRKVGWDKDLPKLREKLISQGLKNIVATIPEHISAIETGMRNQANCTKNNAQPGCNVVVRYQYLALRGLPPVEFFAQLVGAFEAAKLDKRIVGVNIVQAEDGPIAVRDYHLHMQMLDTLHQIYPDIHISLHAGELAASAVSPATLRFHIREAIDKGHALRIGHGVDIGYEDNSTELLKKMAQQQIMVEINLTSNDSLLGVHGKEHPFPLYLRNQVPVALSTDDEGILRTSITREYQRAVKDYHLSYPTLKMLVRNSLSYSFLAGVNLWQKANSQQPIKACAHENLGSATPSSTCNAFLKSSEKARLQWQLERQFKEFEKQLQQKVAFNAN